MSQRFAVGDIPSSLLASCVLALATIAVPGHAELRAQSVTPMVRGLNIDGVEHDLDLVLGLTVSPKGVIVAPVVREHRLQFFDATGKPLSSLGRTGEGPGEFRILGSGISGWIADTLWVYDVGLRRVTLVSPNRKVLRLFVVPGSVTSAKNPKLLAPATLSAMTSAQSLVFGTSRETSVPEWVGAPNGTTGSFMRTDSAGRLVKFLGASLPITVPCARRTGPAQGQLPLCPTDLAMVARDGRRIVFATPVGGNQYRLTSIDAVGGDTVFSRLVAVTAVAIPRNIKDSLQADLAADIRAEPQLGPHTAGLDFPKVFPPFTKLRVGIDGSIWVNDGQELLGRQRWQIFDTNGAPLRTVELPRRTKVHEVSARSAWGTERNTDGFENIVRYDIQP